MPTMNLCANWGNFHHVPGRLRFVHSCMNLGITGSKKDKNERDLWILLLLLTVHSSGFHPSPPFKHIQTMDFHWFSKWDLTLHHFTLHNRTNSLLDDEKSVPRKDISNSRGNSAAFSSSVNFGLEFRNSLWADKLSMSWWWVRWVSLRSLELWTLELCMVSWEQVKTFCVVHLRGEMYNAQLFSSKNLWFIVIYTYVYLFFLIYTYLICTISGLCVRILHVYFECW